MDDYLDSEIIDHPQQGIYFIREIFSNDNLPTIDVHHDAHCFYVCLASDGSFAGNYDDGRDVQFWSLADARNCMEKLTESEEDETDILTTTQAAKIRKVQPSRIRQLILSGQLPAKKIGRDWQIKREDLGKVERCKPGPKPKA